MKLNATLLNSISISTEGNPSNAFTVSEVFIDSRKQVKDGLFIPIVGDRFDGHHFLEAAISNGAIGSLWQKDRPLPKSIQKDFPIFFVEDTLNGLQELARLYRKEVNPIVIGVTGSNGKTTTKDMLESIFIRQYKTHKTKGNFNNHIGLPLTILAMPPECELLILEMGMSGFGEISFLSQLAEPDFAVVTNIGESHIEQLGSRQGIAKAKMEIADGLKKTGVVIIDGDEELLHSYITDKTITCGMAATNKVVIKSIESTSSGISFRLNEENKRFFLPLLGKHNVKNATMSITIARKLHVDDEHIIKGLKSVEITGMRLERRKGLNNSLLINDAYNASPTSMKAAIETIKGMTDRTRKVIVLGDMYELGSDEELLHRNVASVISSPITHVITIGEKGKWIADELLKSQVNDIFIESFETKEKATTTIEQLLDGNTVILFKASRGMKLETIIDPVSV